MLQIVMLHKSGMLQKNVHRIQNYQPLNPTHNDGLGDHPDGKCTVLVCYTKSV